MLFQLARRFWGLKYLLQLIRFIIFLGKEDKIIGLILLAICCIELGLIDNVVLEIQLVFKLSVLDERSECVLAEVH